MVEVSDVMGLPSEGKFDVMPTFEDGYPITLSGGKATVTVSNFTVTTMKLGSVLIYVQGAGVDDWVAVYNSAETVLLGKAYCNGGAVVINMAGDRSKLTDNAFVVKSSVSSGKAQVNFRALKLT